MSGTMTGWTHCRLLAGATVVAFVLLTLPGRWALLGLLWAFVVFPAGVVGAERLRPTRLRPERLGRGRPKAAAPVDADVVYWRTANWGSGRR